MSVMKQGMDALAAKHIADGGTCRTVTLAGVSVDVCLDGNGDVVDFEPLPIKLPIGYGTIEYPPALRELIKLTGQ